MSLEEQRDKLLKRLDALKLFPNNNEVRKLRMRTQNQLERIEEKISISKIILTPEKIKTKSLVRSKKLTKYWRFIKLIHDNFPDTSIIQIRKQFAKRRRGEQVSIPDAVWDNPSP